MKYFILLRRNYMKIISSSETSIYVNGKCCEKTQYDFNNPNVGFAISKINGRYPEVGFFVNEDVQELIYVLEGSGSLFQKNNTISFKKGDGILIDKGEACYWEGDCRVITICCPEWYESQHKLLK